VFGIQTRPRNDVLARVRGRESVVVSRVGCGCGAAPRAAEVLEYIGMPHAAAMHARGGAPWTAEDWRVHAKEEDDVLFPLLRDVAVGLPGQSRAALEAEVASLQKEHVDVVYPAVAAGGVPEERFARVHGAREDALVVRFASALRAEARKRGVARVGRGEAREDGGYDLHSADASRDGARKEILLLEKHVSQERCPECVHKHLDTAIAYLEEAATLDGGDDADLSMARALVRLRSRIMRSSVAVKEVRRALGQRLGRAGHDGGVEPANAWDAKVGIDIMMSKDYAASVEKTLSGEDDPVYQALKSLPGSGFAGMSYGDYLRYKREAEIPEKFQDPRYHETWCHSGDDVANYGYIYVAPTVDEERTFAAGDGTLRAKITVARMRKKVDDFGGDNARKQVGVKTMWEASHESLVANVSEVVNNYQAAVEGRLTPKELQSFADRIGVSVEGVTSRAPSILASLGSNVGDAVKGLLPVVWAAIGPQVMREFKAIADQAAALRSSGEAAMAGADATLAIPILGAVAKVAMAIIQSYEEAKHAACAAYVKDEIGAPLSAAMREGYPYPWHILDQHIECSSTWGAAEKWVPTKSMEFMERALKTNLRFLDAIDPISNAVLVSSMRRWWTLANQLMAYGDVSAVFGALGNDWTGGLIASDEQVALVAAPIAASNGLPIWEFTRALYDQSLGWRDPAVAGLLKPEPWNVCSIEDGAPAPADGGPCIRCKTAAANASVLQWGVLARDAFALAEKAKRGEVPGVAPIGFGAGSVPKVPTSSSMGTLAKLVIGGAASALLYAVGAGVAVAAAPISLAAIWAIASRSKSTPKDSDASLGFMLVTTKGDRETILARVSRGDYRRGGRP
jgi:hypothetical protein